MENDGENAEKEKKKQTKINSQFDASLKNVNFFLHFASDLYMAKVDVN